MRWIASSNSLGDYSARISLEVSVSHSLRCRPLFICLGIVVKGQKRGNMAYLKS